MQSFRPARDSNTDVFLWILLNFFRAPILKNICERLLNDTKDDSCCLLTIQKVLLINRSFWLNPLFGRTYKFIWTKQALIFIFSKDFFPRDRKAGFIQIVICWVKVMTFNKFFNLVAIAEVAMKNELSSEGMLWNG